MKNDELRLCEKQSNQILSHKSVTLSTNRIRFKLFFVSTYDSRFLIKFIPFTISIHLIWQIWLKSAKIFIGYLFFVAYFISLKIKWRLTVVCNHKYSHVLHWNHSKYWKKKTSDKYRNIGIFEIGQKDCV